MEYPAILRDEKKSVKIKLVEYPKIQFMYNNDVSINSIAKKYNVCRETIRLILNKDDYEKSKKTTVKNIMLRYYNEIGFKEKLINQGGKRLKLRRESDPMYNEYHKYMNREWSKKNIS